MLISYKHKFIFIHNPKTAGVSINRALKLYALKNPTYYHNINKLIEYSCITRSDKGEQFLYKALEKINVNRIYIHTHAEELSKTIPPRIWHNFFKFGLVRNPWDRMVSMYFYILQNKEHFLHQKVKTFKNFEDFLEWILKIYHSPRVLQKDIFYDKKGNCLVDFIGKMENLNEEYPQICSKIGVHPELLHRNKSKREADYTKYYNNYTKDLVYQYLKEDIELFNYRF